MGNTDTHNEYNRDDEKGIRTYTHTFNFLLNDYNDIFIHFRSMNTKTGLFLTFMFTTLPLWIQIIDINFVRCIIKKCPIFSGVELSFLFSIAIATGIYLLTFTLFMLVLIPYDFDKLQTRSDVLKNNKFNYKNLYDADYTLIMEDDIRALAYAVSNNREVVNKKGKKFKIGVVLCLAYNIVMIVSIVLKLFV